MVIRPTSPDMHFIEMQARNVAGVVVGSEPVFYIRILVTNGSRVTTEPGAELGLELEIADMQGVS